MIVDATALHGVLLYSRPEKARENREETATVLHNRVGAERRLLGHSKVLAEWRMKMIDN